MNQLQPSYSADVRMFLLVDDHHLEVAQVAVDHCVLREPIEHPPCEGELVLRVNGRERRWRVQLDQGVTRASDRVSIIDQ